MYVAVTVLMFFVVFAVSTTTTATKLDTQAAAAPPGESQGQGPKKTRVKEPVTPGEEVLPQVSVHFFNCMYAVCLCVCVTVFMCMWMCFCNCVFLYATVSLSITNVLSFFCRHLSTLHIHGVPLVWPTGLK